MALNWLLGLGQALSQGGKAYTDLSEQRRQEERQNEQMLIQKFLAEVQAKNMQADNQRADAQEQRAVTAEGRLNAAEKRNELNDKRLTAKTLLENLGEPTQVSPETAALLREAGFDPYVEDRGTSLASTHAFGDLASGNVAVKSNPAEEGGTYAKPFVTPAMKNQQDRLEVQVQGLQDRNKQFYDNLTRLQEKDATIAQLKSDAGMPVNIAHTKDANGNLVMQGIRRDGSVAWERPEAPTGAERTSISDAEQALASLESMKNFRKASFTGPVQGRVNKARAMVGMQNDPQYAAYAAEAATLKNSTIRAITGAQLSPGEATRIMQQIPTDEDADTIWDAKAAVAERNLRELIARKGGGPKGKFYSVAIVNGAPQLQEGPDPVAAGAPPAPGGRGAGPGPGPTQGKTATTDQINRYARARGMSPVDAAKELQSKGWTITGN